MYQYQQLHEETEDVLPEEEINTAMITRRIRAYDTFEVTSAEDPEGWETVTNHKAKPTKRQKRTDIEFEIN